MTAQLVLSAKSYAGCSTRLRKVWPQGPMDSIPGSGVPGKGVSHSHTSISRPDAKHMTVAIIMCIAPCVIANCSSRSA